MKKLSIAMFALLLSASSFANEYVRNTISCTISGDEQSVSRNKDSFKNVLNFEINVTSLKDSSKIIKTELGKIRKKEGYYSNSSSEIENKKLSEALQIDSFKKDRYLDIELMPSSPSDVFDMETRFVVKMEKLDTDAIQALLSELKGSEAANIKDSNFKNKSLKLKAKTDYKKNSTMRVQIHFPVDSELDGLSYHINFGCRK